MSILSQSRWREIRSSLLELMPFDVLGHRHIHISKKPSEAIIADIAKLPKQLLTLEKPYAKDIDEAVENWTKGQQLSLPSDDHKIYFSYRVSAAASFAGKHTMTSRIDESTVFVEPSCSNEIAMAFLLTHWWYEHGYDEYYSQMKTWNLDVEV